MPPIPTPRTPAQAPPSPRVAHLATLVADHAARGNLSTPRPIAEHAAVMGLPTDAATLSALAIALRDAGFLRGGGRARDRITGRLTTAGATWWPPAWLRPWRRWSTA